MGYPTISDAVRANDQQGNARHGDKGLLSPGHESPVHVAAVPSMWRGMVALESTWKYFEQTRRLYKHREWNFASKSGPMWTTAPSTTKRRSKGLWYAENE